MAGTAQAAADTCSHLYAPRWYTSRPNNQSGFNELPSHNWGMRFGENLEQILKRPKGAPFTTELESITVPEATLATIIKEESQRYRQ
ncbi:MAG: hypothetical protein Q9213_007905 [Squamulea squamosa]